MFSITSQHNDIPVAIDTPNIITDRLPPCREQSRAETLINHIALREDLSIEIPALIVSEGQASCIVEIYTGLNSDPTSSLNYLASDLDKLLPDLRIEMRHVRYSFIPSQEELFSLRTLIVKFPEITAIELKDNHLVIAVKQNTTKVQTNRLIHEAKESLANHDVIIVNDKDSILFFDQNINTSHNLLSLVWSKSPRFLKCSNIVAILSSDAGDIVAHFENFEGKNQSLKNAADFLSNNLQLDKGSSHVLTSPRSRHTLRQCLSKIPENVYAVKISEEPKNINIATVAPLEDSARSIDGLNKIASSKKIRYFSLLSNESFAHCAFECVPTSWGLVAARLDRSGKIAHLEIKNITVSNITDNERQQLAHQLRVERILLNQEAYIPVQKDSMIYTHVASRISTGLELEDILQNVITHQLKIVTRRVVPLNQIKSLENFLNTEITNLTLARAALAPPRFVQNELNIIGNAGVIFTPTRRSNYKHKLVGLGGCREIGGSSLLLETPEANILLDHGARFGTDDNHTLDNEILSKLDFIIISHAHMDHIALLPSILRRLKEINPDYQTKILATEATFLLGKYVHKCADQVGLDTIIAASKYLENANNICLVKQGIRYQLTPNTYVTFSDSGHILGSCTTTIETKDTSVTYSGDLQFGYSRMHNRAKITSSDILVMEATNGGTPSYDRLQTEKDMFSAIRETLEDGGKVLAPVLVIGKSTEFLTILHNNIDFFRSNPQFQVYIDGSIHNMIELYGYFYKKNPELFNQDNLSLLSWLIRSNSLLRQVDKSARKSIASDDRPKIIVTSSGMLNGLAAEYFNLMQLDEKNLLLLSSYQASGTKGARLLEHLQSGQYSEEFKRLKMRTKQFRLSAHSSHQETVDYVNNVDSSLVLFVHGEDQATDSLVQEINGRSNKAALVMQRNKTYVLNHQKQG